MSLFIRVFSVLLLFFPLSAFSVTVETFDGFSDGTVLTTQISGLSISAPGGDAQVNQGVLFSNAPAPPSSPTGCTSGCFEGPIAIDFLTPTNTISALVELFPISGDSGLALVAYSGLGLTGSILGIDFTATDGDILSVVFSNIRSALFITIDGGFTAYSLDNLTYDLSPVPLPAAAWLFISGILGLAGFARRKRT